ncbi:MAG: 16S rRNA (cytidine(1402)-2'-O)-methyltransferase [Bacillota bacterium]
MELKTGKLYLVATPLGNLEDITQRALRTLNEVDFIAAEDTRRTLKLLNHFQIKKSLLSYYKDNERERAGQIIEMLRQGADVALVSDAGMPGISDPGNLIVAEAVKQGITIVPIPGATAVITALAASGLDTGSFWFVGFLPRKKSEQLSKLQEMSGFNGTLVVYESPHRLLQTLKNIFTVFGDRRLVIARELTKVHEEFIRGSLANLIPELAAKEVKGEFTIVIEGAALSVKNHRNSTNLDMSVLFMGINGNETTLRKALKGIAGQTGKSLKEVYQLYLEHQKK